MAHLHEMRDSDKHFVINPESMVITNNSKKKALQQGDHRSEIYTFELPRQLDGHDMTLCNLVEIHYINIKGDKTEQSKDIHKVTDMAVSDTESDTLVFTWTIHGNATKYAGSLNFRIHFYCIDADGNYTYKKHTEIFKGITISDGFDNTESVEGDHSDILSQWEARLDDFEARLAVLEAYFYASYFDIDYDGIVSLKAEYRADGAQNSELPEIIIIPDVIKGIAVSALSENMFRENNRVNSVTIPNGVISIPKGFAYKAYNLEEVKGTENIEVIGNGAFRMSGIKKLLLPKLKAFDGTQHFYGSANLSIVDIGNTVTSIPKACFFGCESLSLFRGGASVTDIGQTAFFATRSLKNLPLISNVKYIGEGAFQLSRVNFDWWNHKFSSVGTNGTPAKFNPTDWWSSSTYEACENPLGSTFNQENTEWASVQIPNSSDTYGDGCNEISAAHIYSALTGETFDSPRYFVENIVGGIDNGSLLVPTSTEYDEDRNPQPAYGYDDFEAWLEALGLDCEIVKIGENLQAVYNALKDGALVLTYIHPGHAGVIYGIAANGEVLVLDSGSYQYMIGNYVAETCQQPIWSLTISDAQAIIVKKKNA